MQMNLLVIFIFFLRLSLMLAKSPKGIKIIYYLDGSLRDSIQITLSSLCDATASFLLILLHNTNLL